MKTILLATLFLSGLAAQAATGSYHEVARFKLGGDGGWDLLSVDDSGLFIARGNRVMAIDPLTGTLRGEIAGVEGAHGVAIAPKHKLGFATAGKLGQVWAFDTKTLEVKEKIPAGENPDAILYDPFSDRVFAFNGKSSNATVIDASSRKVVGTIAVDGKPELGASDGKGKLFLNLEDKSAIVEIDAKKLKVLRTFPLAPCEEPTGIAYSAASRRLFVGCGGNGLAAVVDSKSGKVLMSLPVGKGVDGAAFDPARKLAFFPAGGDGKLTILRETNGGFEAYQELTTQKSARTVALDGKSGKAYLPAAEFGAPAEGKKRGAVLPGSFSVIVVGP